MKPSALLRLVIACLVLAIAAGILFAYWRGHDAQPPQVSNSNDPYMQELENNRRDLRSYMDGAQIEENILYRSVIQLAQVADPVALTASFKLQQSESRYLREGAAQALGYYDDAKAFEALQSLMRDKESSVRAFAIQGLGRLANQDRRDFLETLKARQDLSDAERIAVVESAFRAGSATAEKTAALSSLADLALKSRGELSTNAALKMVELSPESEHTRAVLRQKISEGKDARVMGTGIRQLSSQGDGWIKSRLAGLAKHEDPMVRKGVIQSLHRICPTDRWVILDSILATEENLSVVEVSLDEPLLIPEPEAEVFLRKALELEVVKKFALPKAQKNLADLREAKTPNPCAAK